MAVHLIAITGGSGSGKTWLARKLQRRLGRRAGLLSLDDFYRDLSALPPRERDRVNFDHPDAIDWDLFRDCLRKIRRGEPVRLPGYDFVTHTRKGRTRRWEPRPVLVIDGLWLLRDPGIRRLFAHTVFVECPEEVRLARCLVRDQAERGWSRAAIRRRWRAQVKPMHDAHVAPQASLAKMVVTPESVTGSLARLDRRVEQLTRNRKA